MPPLPDTDIELLTITEDDLTGDQPETDIIQHHSRGMDGLASESTLATSPIAHKIMPA